MLNFSLPLKMDNYVKAIDNVILNIFKAERDERILIVSTYVPEEKWNFLNKEELRYRRESFTIAELIFKRLKQLNFRNSEFIFYEATFQHGKEPPEWVEEKLVDCDIAILLTYDSLTHTDARKKATDKGVRIMSSPLFQAAMMENDGPLSINYDGINENSIFVAEKLEKAKWAEISSDNGTNIKVYFEGNAIPDIADLSKKGSFANLPAGEGSIGLTNKGSGIIKGLFKGKEVEIEVRNGYAHEILSGNDVSNEVRKILFENDSEEILKKRRQLAELGIGTNYALLKNVNKWLYSTLTAEKIPGAHIALGNNTSYGGKNNADYHQDFVILFADVYLNNGILMEKGTLVKNGGKEL